MNLNLYKHSFSCAGRSYAFEIGCMPDPAKEEYFFRFSLVDPDPDDTLFTGTVFAFIVKKGEVRDFSVPVSDAEARQQLETAVLAFVEGIVQKPLKRPF